MSMGEAVKAYLDFKFEENKMRVLEKIKEYPKAILLVEDVEEILLALGCNIQEARNIIGGGIILHFKKDKIYFEIEILENRLIKGFSYKPVGESPDEVEKEMIGSLAKIKEQDKPLHDFIVSESGYREICIEDDAGPALISLVMYQIHKNHIGEI